MEVQAAAEGRYASPLISDRFQVLQSLVGETFYIADHQQKDMVIREGKKIRRFESKKEALEWLAEFTKDDNIIYRNKGVESMEPEITALVEKAPRGAIGAFTKGLIQSGMDNDHIIAEINKQFPGKEGSLASVRTLRSKLNKEAGTSVPRAPRAPRAVAPETHAISPSSNGAAEPDAPTLEQIGRTLQSLGATLVKMESEARKEKGKTEALLKSLRAIMG